MNSLTRLAGVAEAAAEGSDQCIQFHPSFSEDTVWVDFWADYFGLLDLFSFPVYALLAKLWVGRH